MPPELRIVIIADDPLARMGLAALLAGEPGCQVIGQAPAGSNPVTQDLKPGPPCRGPKISVF